MRLWHKDLIPYLPRQQLIAQWRELCCIIKNIARHETSNHTLVNKALSSRGDFYTYTQRVLGEMGKRGYKISDSSLTKFTYYFNWSKYCFESNSTHFNIYPDWHNERYLKQCIYNLQEKYDCGEIPENEWKRIEDEFGEYLK